jgi:hypothetical protein
MLSVAQKSTFFASIQVTDNPLDDGLNFRKIIDITAQIPSPGPLAGH